jgi:hypothetical protein
MPKTVRLSKPKADLIPYFDIALEAIEEVQNEERKRISLIIGIEIKPVTRGRYGYENTGTPAEVQCGDHSGSST